MRLTQMSRRIHNSKVLTMVFYGRKLSSPYGQNEWGFMVVYIPTVLKTHAKNDDLYIFAKFFKITSQKKADIFIKQYAANELGKELIMAYNNAVSNANNLTKIENSPYFIGRLTEAQLEEERKKARMKGKKEGEKEGEKKGELKKAIQAAHKMLSRGIPFGFSYLCLPA